MGVSIQTVTEVLRSVIKPTTNQTYCPTYQTVIVWVILLLLSDALLIKSSSTRNLRSVESYSGMGEFEVDEFTCRTI